MVPRQPIRHRLEFEQPEEEEENEDDNDNNLKSIKFSILIFRGTNDLAEYLDWKDYVELIYNCHHFIGYKKVQMAASQFKDYASWWQKLCQDNHTQGIPPVNNWRYHMQLMEVHVYPRHTYQIWQASKYEEQLK